MFPPFRVPTGRILRRLWFLHVHKLKRGPFPNKAIVTGRGLAPYETGLKTATNDRPKSWIILRIFSALSRSILRHTIQYYI